MAMLAELVDAIIGGDTHRDAHTLEVITPTGATIATLAVGNDEPGFTSSLAWIAEHAPGPRLVVGLEGTRSYGIGLARAVQAAGIAVVEVERPVVATGDEASPTRSTPTSPRCKYCDCPQTGCPPLALTATAKPCGSCSAHAVRSPPLGPVRSTGYAHCCSPEMKPTAISLAAPSPTTD
ncbi:hypothetical protein E1181_20855 [Saccharopolyspora terrae]|uniref:Transposase IS110-like N-terminal domain-containing protein n=1 Tax=Saccharopolyspora terrae TaxID=2530384 RepID=A0A4R4VEQ9_9PSEU|nr:transposase [Saccharopolyspora terrae]TDD03341.1 hypothetical protein E1181_20855 [Saccharopolyspora terrae]